MRGMHNGMIMSMKKICGISLQFVLPMVVVVKMMLRCLQISLHMIAEDSPL